MDTKYHYCLKFLALTQERLSELKEKHVDLTIYDNNRDEYNIFKYIDPSINILNTLTYLSSDANYILYDKIFIDELCKINKIEEINFFASAYIINNDTKFKHLQMLIANLTSLKEIDLSSIWSTDYDDRLNKKHLIPLAKSLIQSKSMETIRLIDCDIGNCLELIEFLDILQPSTTIKMINLAFSVSSKYVHEMTDVSKYPFELHMSN